MAREQRRGRRIAMSKEELDEFLTTERTCRVATTGPSGPHNTPLWFVWDGAALWFTSLVRSQRWTDMERDPRVAVVIDTGTEYGESVGEAPRTGEPNAELEKPESLIAAKYFGGQMHHDGRHAWLRLVPEKITSWDFRKI
jgi:general stress protein 26